MPRLIGHWYATEIEELVNLLRLWLRIEKIYKNIGIFKRRSMERAKTNTQRELITQSLCNNYFKKKKKNLKGSVEIEN
jgi:hypothetical protein